MDSAHHIEAARGAGVAHHPARGVVAAQHDIARHDIARHDGGLGRGAARRPRGVGAAAQASNRLT